MKNLAAVIAWAESACQRWDNGPELGSTRAAQTASRPLSCYDIRHLKC